MDDFTAAKAGGGFKFLADEALSGSFGSSNQIFANAPAATKAVEITVRGATLAIRKSGTATTTNGHDYAVGTWWFTAAQSELLNYRAIQSGGTATAFVTYYGLS